MEFVASLGNFAWLSSDYVSFILLLLNLITSTFHNQSKNRRQNSSYEKHNTSWWFSILPVVLQLLFSHQWLWNKLYKAILFQFLDCFSLVNFLWERLSFTSQSQKISWLNSLQSNLQSKGDCKHTPLWLLIGGMIFPTYENTIIHNYSDWTYDFFHVCKTLLVPQIGSNSYQYASI